MRAWKREGDRAGARHVLFLCLEILGMVFLPGTLRAKNKDHTHVNEGTMQRYTQSRSEKGEQGKRG